MPRAHIAQPSCERLPVKAVHRISAEQREGARLVQVVPERFQADRGIALAIGPKERDHLPENSRPVSALPCSRDEPADDLSKAPRLRLPINEELRQDIRRIQQDKL